MGYGTATLTGSGTVYPAIGGGLISFVSSGIVSGSGSVVGCGTLVGSGTFTATGPYTTAASSSPTKTVEIYVSYCPTSGVAGYGMPLLGNISAQAGTVQPYRFANTSTNSSNSTLRTTNNATANSTIDADYPCRQCPNSAGICCPRTTICDSAGKCPWKALIDNGYIKYGLNMVEARNLSDGSIGPVRSAFPISI